MKGRYIVKLRSSGQVRPPPSHPPHWCCLCAVGCGTLTGSFHQVLAVKSQNIGLLSAEQQQLGQQQMEENRRRAEAAAKRVEAAVAIGETVILLTLPLPLLGVSIDMARGRQQNDRLADG